MALYIIIYIHFLSDENQKDNGTPEIEPNGSGSAQSASPNDENGSSENGDDKKSESKLQVPVLSLVSFGFGTSMLVLL